MWFKVKDYEYISPLGGGVGVILGFILTEGRQIFLENWDQLGKRISVYIQNEPFVLPIQNSVVVFYC